MSSLSVFPPPPAEGEITLCEFNARLIAESSKTAKLSKYVPATQVSFDFICDGVSTSVWFNVHVLQNMFDLQRDTPLFNAVYHS